MPGLIKYATIAYRWRIQKKTVLDYLPEDISIEVTNTCNFKCSFCPQSSAQHFSVVKRTMLDPDSAELLLQKLRRGGVTSRVIHWTLDGEPFVNRKFHQICARAINHGFRYQIFSTNGALAEPDRVRELPLARDCQYRLCVDFSGDEEYFEQVRGTKGSWQKIRSNLRGILQDPTLAHVNIIVSDISSFRYSGAEELARRRHQLRSVLPTSNRLLVTDRAFHNMTGYVQLRKKPAGRYHVCPYPWMSLVVASNGDVVACCRDLEHKTVLGNLLEQELVEIWNSPAYQRLRDRLARGAPNAVNACQKCDLPYDAQRFGAASFLRAARHRLNLFAR